MNTTPAFNVQDWSGDVVTIDYTDAGEFTFRGTKWNLEVVHDTDEAGDAHTFVTLNGDGWDEPLKTFIYIEFASPVLESMSDRYTLEDAVIEAARWISNYV